MLQARTPIAKEGYPFIAIAAFVTILLANIEWYWAMSLSLLATFFITYFFRDPERFTPDVANAVICPADGKIILIDEIEDNVFTEQKAIKVSVFMNVFNVHVNRIPISGSITKIFYRPGKFYSADSTKGAEYNEYCCALMTTQDKEHKIAFVQVAGLIARRIVCWLETGDKVKTGQRYGLIRFGSRVDLYLPVAAKIDVSIGQKVTAGETVIATLPEKS